MFSIELNPDLRPRELRKIVDFQMKEMNALTDYECRAFADFCESVGRPEVREFVESFVRQRRPEDDDVYIVDAEVAESIEPKRKGGGRRVIRSTKGM